MIQQQNLHISKRDRSCQKSQTPKIIWLTGLSGAGKSTIANELDKILFENNKHSYILDGDNIRSGLSQDLSFTDTDRIENIRRIAEVSKLFLDAGVIVITAFISPFIEERNLARSLFEQDEFFEVFINTPIETAEKRDVKGLYKKAREGKIKLFTGIDSPYEKPISPEIEIITTELSAYEAAQKIYNIVFL